MIVRVLPHRDLVELEVALDHRLRRSALVALQRKGRRLGESAEPDGLHDRALAAHPRDLRLVVPLEQLRLHLGVRSREPLVAEPAHADGELPVTEPHRGHHAGALDAVRGVRRRLGRGHRKAQEEVVIRGQRLQRLLDRRAVLAGHVDDVQRDLAQEEQRRRGVAAVQLVAHVQGALHQGFQRDVPGAAHRLRDDRRHHVLDEQQPLLHALVVHAVVEAARIGAFVEVAVAEVAAVVVAHREHRHRRGVDAGERAHCAAVVASADPQLSGFELGDGLLAVRGQTLELRGADDRVALAALVLGEGQRRPGGEDGLAAHAGEMLDGGPQIHEHGLRVAQAFERRAVCSNTVDIAHQRPPGIPAPAAVFQSND